MVRTRFAPSPTGYLHIGGVRTALFNWLLARQAGGQFLLRIDDTDQQRNVEAALQPILDGFRWLGLDWDEGPQVGGPHAPYFQSQRGEYYAAAVKQLLANGYAYRDFARPEELQEQRTAAEKAGEAFVYDRRYMAEDDATAAKFAAEGRSCVVRMKMPREGECIIQDHIRGEVRIEWAGEQDHVIQRADGSCLYHLASVVDDYLFEITHVVRAAEHLPNTPRQIFIAQGLGYPLPEYAHLPYVAEPGGTAKLSKRKLDKYLKNKDFAALLAHGQRIAERSHLQVDTDTFNPVIVDFYREIGFLPDAILNYLLLVGWSLDGSTEKFTREEMIKHFSLARVNKAPASFDTQKMMAFQTDQMVALETTQKVAMVLPYLQRAGLVNENLAGTNESMSTESMSNEEGELAAKIGKILTAVGDRVKVAGDILDYDFCFVSAERMKYDEKAFEKRIAAAPEVKPLLDRWASRLSTAKSFVAADLDAELHRFCEAEGIQVGQIIHALRVAVTGQSVGFGMFDSMEIIGRDECIARIRHTLLR